MVTADNGIRGVLFSIPWPTNERYAMHRAEAQFHAIGVELTGSDSNTHFSFANLSRGHPQSLPAAFRNYTSFSFHSHTQPMLRRFTDYIREHGINVIAGYDLPVRNAAYLPLRRAGVEAIISYWGAPMSSINRPVKRLLKRGDVLLSRARPDRFVFQCEAMRATATLGRGIPLRETSVVFTGVDIDQLLDRGPNDTYPHDTFGIPRDRKLVVFSGHIHPRKGLSVLLDAADVLVNKRGREDIHFLLLGRIQDESHEFIERTAALGLNDAVTFCGYRDDIFRIFAGCTVGVIPTTGWDSFPRSVLEMQGCGLPVLASRLQGLPEMIVDGVTGMTFATGDAAGLADRLQRLCDDVALNERMGNAARERIIRDFDQRRLIQEMAQLIRETLAGKQVSPPDQPATAPHPVPAASERATLGSPSPDKTPAAASFNRL